MKEKLRIIVELLKRYRNRSFFGFVQGHSYINQDQVKLLSELALAEYDSSIISRYEATFAATIASKPEPSFCVSYAAGRMAFYALLRYLKIGEGDEVILQGHTCSVMPNAIIRTGATPIFADIDANTFGSSAVEIEKVITSRTKVIVAQHSFGIPCDILPIVKLAKRYGIFLLEDCAITVGSKVNGVQVGNFGDAAIFSTDHSKPLNTIIGGLLFTRNTDIYKHLKNEQSGLPGLSSDRQIALFATFIFEQEYYNPQKYGQSFFMNKIKKLRNRYLESYLTNDYGEKPSTQYPYPARMPTFLAQLGLFEIDHWNQEQIKRQSLLRSFLSQAEAIGLKKYIPKIYYDNKVEIIPLRFVYAHPEAAKIKRKMSNNIDVDWIWFREPIITCSDPHVFGYTDGSCHISEETGREIINWPCIFSKSDNIVLLDYFRKAHNQ
ncbi:MAG: DegT/DnrJ/EryC1/StrS family aminotransferase [Candidatus Marinimicrobia bacterium]|nr:DegT/DnrJ/EryC1/StrS family aminotransferase [Candidatus Neomarinimicrobiota bacterium]